MDPDYDLRLEHLLPGQQTHHLARSLMKQEAGPTWAHHMRNQL